jgi:hypothetical protein
VSGVSRTDDLPVMANEDQRPDDERSWADHAGCAWLDGRRKGLPKCGLAVML